MVKQEFEDGKSGRLLEGEIEDKLDYLKTKADDILAKLDNPSDPVVTEDLGTNTNPEKFITDNAFSSQVATSTGTAAAVLYDPATTPARTAGKECYIYEILIYNFSGATATVHLELADGTVMSIRFAVNNLDSIVVSLAKPIRFGDMDVYYQASAADVEVQVTGLEV